MVKWSEGQNRTCSIIRSFQKDKSEKWVVIKVENEFNEIIGYQASAVYLACNERYCKIENLSTPYMARPFFDTQPEAEKHCKEQIEKQNEK